MQTPSFCNKSRSLKVAFLKSRAHFRGGLEKYTHHLVKAFVAKNCQVTLLTTGTPPSIDGVDSISLAPDSKFSLLNLTRFDSLCQKWLLNNPQEVIFGLERTTQQTHYRAGSGVHAVFLKQRKLIDPLWKRVSFSLNPLHRKILAMEKEAFESPDLKVLFTNSEMVKKEILAHYRTSVDKISVVHNGVEWNKWRTPFEESFHSPRKGPFQLLFIGNGYKRKGLLFLLRGLSLLKKEDFFLTIVGKEKNPSLFSHDAEKLGLKDKVKFLGPQLDILPFYQRADALVIPSLYDPFANVTLEALAMGLFVITSPFNGGKEILTKECGTLIEDLTAPESVANALRQGFNKPKTEESGLIIRQSIKDLDFSNQLDKIVSQTLTT